ncbi:hypothetical protein B0H15DRAFT_807719 [Mycena belliarum]|uniref:Uncharacterized protein n=1 Tax=Mycena belliarum TaxID=1033014 RepID=A0AAD6TKC5_9AGAR|nr:hypothetical protein B0H15DRAFT_807719 [Mycena belliae]
MIKFDTVSRWQFRGTSTVYGAGGRRARARDGRAMRCAVRRWHRAKRGRADQQLAPATHPLDLTRLSRPTSLVQPRLGAILPRLSTLFARIGVPRGRAMRQAFSLRMYARGSGPLIAPQELERKRISGAVHCRHRPDEQRGLAFRVGGIGVGSSASISLVAEVSSSQRAAKLLTFVLQAKPRVAVLVRRHAQGALPTREAARGIRRTRSAPFSDAPLLCVFIPLVPYQHLSTLARRQREISTSVSMGGRVTAARSNGEACEPGPVYKHADAEARAWDAEAQLRDVEPDSDAACVDDDEEQALSAHTIDGLRATTYADFAAANGCGAGEGDGRGGDGVRRRGRRSSSSTPAASAPAAKHARRIPNALERPRPSLRTLLSERLRGARATCAESDYEQHRRKSSMPPPPTHRARSVHGVSNAPRREPRAARAAAPHHVLKSTRGGAVRCVRRPRRFAIFHTIFAAAADVATPQLGRILTDMLISTKLWGLEPANHTANGPGHR